ncbi:MAG: hypothetical protein MJE68_17640 [Proteobacteria bacterium]|nr:hypothetical protein [Pseudomonadota bacterium]
MPTRESPESLGSPEFPPDRHFNYPPPYPHLPELSSTKQKPFHNHFLEATRECPASSRQPNPFTTIF